jgi:hypothetical protein
MHLFGPEDCAAGVSGLRVYTAVTGEVEGPARLYNALGKPVEPEHSSEQPTKQAWGRTKRKPLIKTVLL